MFIYLQLMVITCLSKVMAFRLGVKVSRRVRGEAHLPVHRSTVAAQMRLLLPSEGGFTHAEPHRSSANPGLGSALAGRLGFKVIHLMK